MKYCEHCGAGIPDAVKFCPECGAPQKKEETVFAEYVMEEPEDGEEICPEETVSPEPERKTVSEPEPEPAAPARKAPEKRAEEPVAAEKPVTDRQPAREEEPEPRKKVSGLSIAAFICCILLAFIPVGVVLAIVDLVKSRSQPRKKGLSIAALVIGGTVLLLGVIGNLIDLSKCSSSAASSGEFVSIEAGDSFLVGLRKNGTVAFSRENPEDLQDISKWSGITMIDADRSGRFVFGVRKNGTVAVSVTAARKTAAERNGFEQQVEAWKDIVSVEAGKSRVYGVKKDGTVVIAFMDEEGENSWPSKKTVLGWKEIEKIEEIGTRVYGLKKDGSIVYTETGSMVQMKKRNKIAGIGGPEREIILHSDGKLESFWDDSKLIDPTVLPDWYRFELPAWTDIKKVLVFSDHAIGLKKDGTAVSVFARETTAYNAVSDTYEKTYGGNRFGECDVEGFRDLVDIAGCSLYTAGLKKDGTILIAGKAPWFTQKEWETGISAEMSQPKTGASAGTNQPKTDVSSGKDQPKA